ncbi:MAG: hypothetical protein ACLGHX_08395 [Acidimicrobiia bacterium]
MRAHIDVVLELADALRSAGVEPVEPGAPTVVTAPRGQVDWASTLAELTSLFRKAKAAAEAGHSVVFVIGVDALLGRDGALDAMAATGVVSAARTLALGLRKQGAVANCIAVDRSTPNEETARWIVRLLEATPDGPTGELLQLGGGQIGKALS